MIVFVIALLPVMLVGVALLFFRGFGASQVSRLIGKWVLPGSAVFAFCWIWLNACGVFNAAYDRWLEVDRWPSQPLTLSAPPSSRNASATPLRSATSSGRTAIIVLGGGTEYTGPHRQLRPEGDSIEKVALAANTYDALVATAPPVPPLIIISGGDPEHHGGTEADTYAPELVGLGVPAADVIAENRSQNTYQNAEYVAPLLAGRQIDRLILITTAMHMRRSMLNFDRFGMHAEPLAPAVRRGHLTLWPDVENLKRAGAALHEVIGIQQFHVYRAVHLF